jgi:hypothetical protein
MNDQPNNKDLALFTASNLNDYRSILPPDWKQLLANWDFMSMPLYRTNPYEAAFVHSISKEKEPVSDRLPYEPKCGF